MAIVRKDIFEELNKVKDLIKKEYPNFDVRNLCDTLAKLGTYHYHKKFMLLGDVRGVYELLIKNSYNPYTVYRWALLERVPEDIRFQLRNHNLGQKKATRLFFDRRHETETSLQLEIKQMGLKLIREM